MEEAGNSEPALFQVSDDLKPKSSEEFGDRYAYYTSAILYACTDLIQSGILAFRDGQFGNALQLSATRDFTDEEFGSAVKELCCVSIYLAVLEQGGEAAPPWLVEFLFASLRATDKLAHGPRSREIMQMHEFTAGIEAICQDAAIGACRSLGLGEASLKAAEPIESYLKSNAPYRAELLRFALTEPVEALQQHIQSLV